MTDTKLIRNFSIIAHIDHGKSTLADQFLLKTGAISEREFRNQVLDAMDLERERGITIQMHPVTVYHQHEGQTYELNLIDTPGHVDFNYEVSRSLAACEGVILLVDAFQGVQAQTVANAYLAMEGDLTIVPVLNKIDLPIARPDEVIAEMEQALGIDPEDVLRASGKTGIGVEEVLARHHRARAAAAGRARRRRSRPWSTTAISTPTRASSSTSASRKARSTRASSIRLMRGGTEHEVIDIGQFRPAHDAVRRTVGRARSATSWPRSRRSSDVHIGDTVTDAAATRPPTPLPGYKEPKPMVFSGLYPVNNNDFETLREALGKLQLNDSSFTYQPEISEGLGFGFRCGFLGMLHREIIQQRLERDSELDLVQTAPTSPTKS